MGGTAAITRLLAVPSVILGEPNYLLNPAHPDFQRISFAEPVPFRFDVRLIARNESDDVLPSPNRDWLGLILRVPAACENGGLTEAGRPGGPWSREPRAARMRSAERRGAAGGQ